MESVDEFSPQLLGVSTLTSWVSRLERSRRLHQLDVLTDSGIGSRLAHITTFISIARPHDLYRALSLPTYTEQNLIIGLGALTTANKSDLLVE